MSKERVIDKVVTQFERNIALHKRQRPTDGAKYAAYEDARILRRLDEEIGNEAVNYLREQGL